MAVINDPDLREVARQIVSDPGFSRTSNESLRLALQRFTERTTSYQRLRVAESMIIQWLLGEHAEYVRSQDRRPALPGAAEGDGRLRVVAGQVAESGAPAAELKFRSESPDWQHPAMPGIPDSPGGHTTLDAHAPLAAGGQDSPQASVPSVPISGPPAGDNASRGQSTRDPHRSLAAADDFPGGHAPLDTHRLSAAGEQPSPEPLPAPVQQPSRKVAAYQRMFPELGFRVQTASGAKLIADFTKADIGFRRGELHRQRQAWRGENTADEARIEDRERLNARDRVRVAERAQNIRDAEAEEERLTLAERELDGYDCAVIGELPPEALAACGFKRRAA